MDLAAIAELDRRFGIPGIARVVEGNGGLAKVAINTRETAGEMYLHGVHVTSWQPRRGGSAFRQCQVTLGGEPRHSRRRSHMLSVVC